MGQSVSSMANKLVKPAAAVLAASLLALAAVGPADAKTIRAVMHSGLRITDPILTTAISAEIMDT